MSGSVIPTGHSPPLGPEGAGGGVSGTGSGSVRRGERRPWVPAPQSYREVEGEALGCGLCLYPPKYRLGTGDPQNLRQTQGSLGDTLRSCPAC